MRCAQIVAAKYKAVHAIQQLKTIEVMQCRAVSHVHSINSTLEEVYNMN
jgi:hypothetical protein